MKPPVSLHLPTLRIYAQSAQADCGSGPGGPAGVSRHLYGFLQRLQPGASILELGCGGGREAEAMIAAGFKVDPTDGSPEMARKAEARLRQSVRVMRFDELDAGATYDAVWANASLLYVPRRSLPAVLARVSSALKPGGLHFASYKGGNIKGRDNQGRYFNFLAREELIAIYNGSAAWEIEAIIEYSGGSDGNHGPWIAITARKPG